MIEVDPADPAFADPTQADRPALHRRGSRRPWPRSRAGPSSPTATHVRRVVPSPAPQAHLREAPDRVGCSSTDASSSAPAAAASRPRYGRGPHSSASRPSSTRTTPAACWPATSTPTVFVMATDAACGLRRLRHAGAASDRRGPPGRAAGRAPPTSSPPARCCPKVVAACDFARATGQRRRRSARSPTSRRWSPARAGTRIATDVDGVDLAATSTRRRRLIMALGVHSEVGKLRKVLVHRPGLEHTRLTPVERRRAALRRRALGRSGPSRSTTPSAR